MTTIKTLSWQISSPIDAIVFDCDGTLTKLEGVDELAKHRGNHAVIAEMTAQAMGKLGINIELYNRRLELVQPTEEQTIEVGHQYFKNLTTDTQHVISFFQQIGKPIFLVSSGLYQSVRVLGEHLQIPDKNIFAVHVKFNNQGEYETFDQTSPLVTSKGKRFIVHEIKKTHPNLLFVGDGLNDFAVYDLVSRFVGYGGAFYRENIAALCEFYIKTPSMLPLIPLALTQLEEQQLTGHEKSLFEKGLAALDSGEVLMNMLDKQQVKKVLSMLGAAD